jgi:hypothetical protein
MDGRPSSPVLRVGDRVVPSTAYRPTAFVGVANTVAWWTALMLLGAGLVGAGALVDAGLGEVTAIAGVALFLATAVVAGAERTELATALGTVALVWTASGIAVVLGTDPSRPGSLVAFTVAGALALVGGAIGAARARRRDPPRSGSSTPS